MEYERDNIHRLAAYTPGEQPRQGSVVKLNTNENPYPPAPAVLAAIAGVTPDGLRRYPPPRAAAFRAAAAAAHGLTPDQVIATNGGDELLRMAVGVFCEPTQPVAGLPAAAGVPGGLAVEEPTYSLYPVLAEIHDTPLTQIPLNEDWSIPDDFARRAIDSGCRLAIIVNPHAPSGRLARLSQLRKIARQLMGQAVLVIDEAYVDFAGHNALPLLAADSGLDNILLLRSLSKGYSLAGLRFGYGLGHPRLIASLDKARDSYNTDILAQAAATAAVENRDAARKNCRRVIAERTRLAVALVELGYQVFPSESNFLLAVPPGAEAGSGMLPGSIPGTLPGVLPGAREVYETLKRQNIFVRYFDLDRLRDKLRITVGSPEQNDALLAALKAMKPGATRRQGRKKR